MANGNSTPVVVVGIGLRLPGNVTDPDGFWSLLTEGRHCWTSVPTDRYNESAYLHPKADAPATHNHYGGNFLSQDIAAFDAAFFQIPPAEAQAMDPQQRILLETTYDAFQSSGSTLESVRGSNTAVYIATFSSDYDRNIQKDTDDIPKYHTTGTGEAIAANRLSYAFDLKGPSVALDTGCSGSLVAVHYACQSLITGEVEAAIAGGVNLILNPDRMIGMANLGMLNGEGRSYSFDHRGSGYGRGEGSAIVILKTLDEAIRCGDPIRGVIRSTAVNQDGKTSGITSPSQIAQEVLLRRAYRKASLDPRTIHYVEAHGTGTWAGDLAEIGAIEAVFCKDRTSPLYVGSVKSNIAHLEGASGLAGLIKAVLTLEKGIIPPNADFQIGKPELNLQSHNITIPVKLEPFPKAFNRRASVNSFGYGGTNAHLILEEAPSIKHTLQNPGSGVELVGNDHLDNPTVQDVWPRLFVLSARSEVSLRAMVHALNSWTSTHKASIDLGDLAFTLLVRRSHLEWRFAFVAGDCLDILKATDEKTTRKKLQRTSSDVPVAYIFTGQGAQWHAMGRELMTNNSTFKESLEKSESVLWELEASWNLTDELLLDETTSRISKVWLAQPATTAIQIALVDLLRSLGLRPQTVIGHSSGEIAAAYAAGVLSHAAAMQVSYYRGLVCKRDEDSLCFKGAMLAVGLSEEGIFEHIRQLSLDDLSVACVNSPVSTTISGEEASINQLHESCHDKSIFSRRLNIGTAYHSHHMYDASVQYRKHLSSLEVMESGGSQKFISTVTATFKEAGFGPDYWAENLTSKVLFADAVSKFCHLQHNTARIPKGRGAKQIVIEIGPHSALSGAFRQTVEQTAAAFDYSYVPSLVRGTSALSSFLGLLGQLYENGVAMDLDRVRSISPTKPCPAVIHNLPTYPWNHSNRYWHESRLSKQSRFRRHAPHYLLGTQTNSSTPLEPCWRHLIGVDSLPWLQDHVVDNLMVLPGAAYICMAVEAARQLFVQVRGLANFEVVMTNVNFWRVLVIPEAPGKVELYLSLVKPLDTIKSQSDTHREFRISSPASDGSWNEYCSGLLAMQDIDDEVSSDTHQGPVNNGRTTLGNPHDDASDTQLNTEELYHQLEANGNRYGPVFRNIKEARIDSLARLHSRVGSPKIAEIMPSNMANLQLLHPAMMDAVFHSSLPLYAKNRGAGFIMPTRIDFLQFSLGADQRLCEQIHVQTSLEPLGPMTAKADVVAFDDSLSTIPILRVFGIELRGSSAESKDRSPRAQRFANTVALVDWKPDADLLPLSMFCVYPLVTASFDPAMKTKTLNIVALHYIKRTLAKFPEPCKLPSEPYLQHFKAWMGRQQIDVIPEEAIDHLYVSDDEPSLKHVEHLGAEGQLLSRMGESLSSILMEQLKPVDLIFKDNLLYDFYADGPSSQCVNHLSQYLEHLSFKHPNMKILEVGAGTASTTLKALTSLSRTGSVTRLDHYDYTDISSGFFEKARETLARWESLVTFKALDISKNPIEQGFQEDSYDLVIASNVLHATASIKETLANVYKVLKPHGKLAIIEVTQQQPFLGLIFGTLPGWWLGFDDGRTNSPLLTCDQWEKVLKSACFTGLDITVQDLDGPAHTSTFMVSSATVLTNPNASRVVEIITSENPASCSHALAVRLCSRMKMHGLEASLTTWQSHQPVANIIHLVVDCEQDPMLLDPTPERFNQIVDLLTRPSNVLWLSWCSNQDHERTPETALINGLARSAHAENQALRLVTLDIQQKFNLDNCSGLLPIVCNVVSRSFCPAGSQIILQEREYVYRDATVLIPRIIANKELDQLCRRESDRQDVVSLDKDGAYIIAGGLGDIGMRLCKLMARKGAGHIIILSRRREDLKLARSIEHSLQEISADVTFHWRTCDISIEREVRECVEGLSSSGIPRVKGVVQAAVVLKDGTLSQMSSREFSLPLQAKLHGTRALYAAFEHSPLDFFIMLSSISGIVGTSGQANYAASNVFQDTFARSKSTKNCPCISLNLPLIQDSHIKNSIVEQNLEKHGTIAITSDQLISLLGYAMSPRAAEDQYKQVIAGINSESLASTKVVNANANSAMFSHVRSPVIDSPAPETSKSIKSLKDMLSASHDDGETQELLVGAITEKLSNLVAYDSFDRERDVSIAELGLDSLITVELRNWISAELQAAIHVSEILDQTSTRTLARLVASRSALTKQLPEDKSYQNHEDEDESSFESEQEPQSSENMPTQAPTAKLPDLPLPDLTTSLDMYLESRRCFLSPEELEHTSKTIADFLRVDGVGRRLQDRLKARLSDPTVENWLAVPYSRKIYLERRDPIHPCGTFYGGHLLTETAHGQVERAAVIAMAAFDFKLLLEAGTVEQDVLNSEPLCMQSLDWLFNAVREPGIRVDRMVKSSGYEYMIVMRRGHFFQVTLPGHGPEKIPYWDLKNALENILIRSETKRTPVAALTVDERNSWAKLRQHVRSLHETNANVLDTIERAAFVICLDEGQPSTASERCNQFFLGDPSNRWSDKTLQFIVCENGVSAFVGEHAMLDGMSVRQLNSFITKAIIDHKAERDNGDPMRNDQIKDNFREKCAPIEFVHHNINTLGGAFLRAHKCPSKAGYQVIIQLACLLYYGYQPESWETVSMSRFHMGRVDWIPAVQPPMARFCAAALNAELGLAEKRRLFFAAVNNFVTTMTQIVRGHGFKAHMHALLAMVEETETLPELFRDKTWCDTTVASIKTVKTDCLEGAMLQETAFLMPEPRCIFLHYEAEEDRCILFVQAWPGRTRAICEALDTAAEIVRTILSADEGRQ